MCVSGWFNLPTVSEFNVHVHTDSDLPLLPFLAKECAQYWLTT